MDEEISKDSVKEEEERAMAEEILLSSIKCEVMEPIGDDIDWDQTDAALVSDSECDGKRDELFSNSEEGTDIDPVIVKEEEEYDYEKPLCLLCLDKHTLWPPEESFCRKTYISSLVQVLPSGCNKKLQLMMAEAPFCGHCYKKLRKLTHILKQLEHLESKLENAKNVIFGSVKKSAENIRNNGMFLEEGFSQSAIDLNKKFDTLRQQFCQRLNLDPDENFVAVRKKKKLRRRQARKKNQNFDKKLVISLTRINTDVTAKLRKRRNDQIKTEEKTLDLFNDSFNDMDDGGDRIESTESDADRKRRSPSYFCSYQNCKSAFSTEQGKFVHEKKKHEGIQRPFECPYCGKKFEKASRCKYHEATHLQIKDVVCELCGKSFSTNQLLKHHQKNVHMRSNKEYPCDLCSNTYKTQQGLKVHKMSHTKTYPFVCEVCGFACPTKTGLTYHQFQHQENNPLKCPDCGKVSKNPSYFKQHRMTHTHEYPYRCSVCNVGCQTKGHLERHKLIHEDEKKYECDFCQKKFCHRRSMLLHKRRHTNDRRHPCDICGKAFYTKEKMRAHRRIHTGEYPYECHICHKKFMHDGYIQKHLAYHERAIKEGRPLRTRPNRPRLKSESMESDQIGNNSGEAELVTELPEVLPMPNRTTAQLPEVLPVANRSTAQLTEVLPISNQNVEATTTVKPKLVRINDRQMDGARGSNEIPLGTLPIATGITSQQQFQAFQVINPPTTSVNLQASHIFVPGNNHPHSDFMFTNFN